MEEVWSIDVCVLCVCAERGEEEACVYIHTYMHGCMCACRCVFIEMCICAPSIEGATCVQRAAPCRWRACIFMCTLSSVHACMYVEVCMQMCVDVQRESRVQRVTSALSLALARFLLDLKCAVALGI